MNIKVLKAYKGLKKDQILKMSHFVPLTYKGREVVGVAVKTNGKSKFNAKVLKVIPLEIAEFIPEELTFK